MKVWEAMRHFSSRDIAKIILYNPDTAILFYENMNDVCADIIRKNIKDVDVCDACNSGKELYKLFQGMIKG